MYACTGIDVAGICRRSLDYGVTLGSMSPVSGVVKAYGGLATSADGKYVVACVHGTAQEAGGFCYYSDNAGAGFREERGPGLKKWSAVAMTPDGKTIWAATDNNG